jgi:hypothetical protein
VLKQIQYYRLKKKILYISNLRLRKKFKIQKNRFLLLDKTLFELYKNYITDKNISEHKDLLKIFKLYNYFLYKKIYPILKKIKKSLIALKR